MKNKILSIFLALSLLTACDIEYLNDPYVPQKGVPHLYMPQVIYAMAEGVMFDSRYIGCYIQNWNLTAANYAWDLHGSRREAGVIGLTASQTWRNHYWSIGANLNQIETIAGEMGYGKYKGITMVIRAWSWQVATDQFGSMPYDVAWDNTLTAFPYNDQASIYSKIDQLCDEAISELQNNSGKEDVNLATAETIYGGDTQKWIKLAYAIKARLANHISNKSTYNADAVIALVDKAMASSDDDTKIPFTTSADDNSAKFSFMGPGRGNFNSYRPSEFVVGLLNGTQFGVEDPRLSLILTANTSGEYLGVVPGKGLEGKDIPRLYGKYIFQDTKPFPLVTYAEMQFIKAEAAFKKGDKTMALDAFQKGVKAHMTFSGVASGAADDYIQTALPATSDALEIKHILSQKYLALYGFGIHETWSDLRRYGYSGEVFMGFQLPEIKFTGNGGKPVQRTLPTTFSEEDWNRDEFAKIGGMDADYHVRTIWFAEP